jgi:hypothetical protein
MASGADTTGRAKRRQAQRLVRARRRMAVGSALGFAAFLALVGQHAVGSAKGAAAQTAPPPRPAGGPTRYFDDQGDGFAFDDGSAAPLPPPVAQTNVS